MKAAIVIAFLLVLAMVVEGRWRRGYTYNDVSKLSKVKCRNVCPLLTTKGSNICCKDFGQCCSYVGLRKPGHVRPAAPARQSCEVTHCCQKYCSILSSQKQASCCKTENQCCAYAKINPWDY
ncbi:unnamed protein product [Meganyctiphanes norvegica]|uniref:Uncharacterized protein n=1 Tax=Meganyctiphanes norvegica TaxID=48144 RepID=A0AAV2RK43_MEGNR